MTTLTSIAPLRTQPFGTLPDLIHAHAQMRPTKAAVIQEDRTLNYAEFDALVDRVAAALQRDGVKPGDIVAVCAASSIEYAAVFMGGLRAGAGIAPLAPSSTAESLAAMLNDSGAKLFFLDATVAALLDRHREAKHRWITLDESSAGTTFTSWLAPVGAKPAPVKVEPEMPFNIIYSSGTTGTPKGIVHALQLRWRQWVQPEGYDYDADASRVVLVSTPLYSNTTLVSFLPAFAAGATVVLMAKFDAIKFLQLSEKYRVTHAMLVPVQYQRIMAVPDFDKYDLKSFVMKSCTSAPFAAALKADIVKRWPGGLVEYYGMTEGGASCMLMAHENPDKLHTVGKPMPGHEMFLIDENGHFVAQGEVGEIVGRSQVMMQGYLNQPGKTAEAEWYDKEGNRYIRTGDVGRFDAEGFLTLMDRKKDMIISGGFNVYPSDLELVLRKHDAIADAAVVGVPSEQWGETPVAFVLLRAGKQAQAKEIAAWANAQLGKTQRISDVQIVSELPRSAIGKVLKRELRDRYRPQA